MQFTSGFLLSLSLCLEIGLANMAMITLAMHRGVAQGVWLGLGTCVGDLIYAILAMAGMAILLQIEWVRWVLWIGGSAVLCYLTLKMLLSALKARASDADAAGKQWGDSNLALFSRGIMLAMSSPTAILWFAAVGGAIIARQGSDIASAGLFLSGFFAAGVFWAFVLCLLASQGGRLLGQNLIRYTYIASALIFAYFAVYVVVTGYAEFVGNPTAPSIEL
ncbi:LysE family translocator [Pseudomonas putida]|uniref:LysE family translocator n=1 Tax=Pseudomonas putida TaxID=303 RepID=UPI00236701DB|nr:LysE family transporter [Pseudomonas putida]MDD2047744.1 LysE family translocator [Pseudomonas putida]